SRQRGRDRSCSPEGRARRQGARPVQADEPGVVRSRKQAHDDDCHRRAGQDMALRQGRAAGDFRPLQGCKLDPKTETAYDDKVEDLAKHGFRALGVANSGDDGTTWKLLGLLSLLDPPRPDAAMTIAQTRKLGLEVKMVTGDDVAIGSEISSQLTHLLVAGNVFPKGTDPNHIPLDARHAV